MKLTNEINSEQVNKGTIKDANLTTKSLCALLPYQEEFDHWSAIRHYDENQLASLRTLGYDLLEKSCDSIAIDEKLFAHIHADSFGRDTPLEGNTFCVTIPHLASLIKKHGWLPSMSQTIVSQLEQCAVISKKMNECSSQANINVLAQSTSQSILNLQPGETFLFPGGYAGKTSGHAMLYTFTKNLDGMFSMDVINTGDGLNHHIGDGIQNKLKYSTALTYADIPANPVAFQDFIQAAIECKAPMPSRDEVDPPYDADYIYNKIIPRLEGHVVYAAPTAEERMTVQNAGFCAERVVHAYIRQQLLKKHGNLNAYKEFKLQLKRQTLINFFQQSKQAGHLTKESIVISLQKAAEKFGRSLDKRIKATNDTPTDSLESDIAILQAIKFDLKKAQEKIRSASQKADELTYETAYGKYGFAEATYPVSKKQITEKPPLETSKRPTLDWNEKNCQKTFKEWAVYTNQLMAKLQSPSNKAEIAKKIHYFILDTMETVDVNSKAFTGNLMSSIAYLH